MCDEMRYEMKRDMTCEMDIKNNKTNIILTNVGKTKNKQKKSSKQNTLLKNGGKQKKKNTHQKQNLVHIN